MGNGKWHLMVPVVLLGAAVLSLPETGGGKAERVDGEEGVAEVQHQSAGLFSRKSGSNRAKTSGYRRPEGGSKGTVLFRRPPTKNEKGAASNARREITIRKSSAEYEVDFNRPRNRWKYLTLPVRKAIDRAKISRSRWELVVVHNSATSKGSAEVFERYHRDVRKMRNGMAYHFVIGNGSYTKDGEVEVGERWFRQLDGGHLKSSRQNAVSIGICLVGDFDHERVGKAQLEALDELIDYLRAKVGEVEVTTHRQINVVPTTCPGRYFPTKIISG